jgi:DNA-binding transcriptional ArsR family regulator
MLPDIFAALGNPSRRIILDELRDGPRTAGELTGLLAQSRSAASEHLAVLREAGLVREERQGRHRLYHLQAAGLAEVGGWLKHYEHYWNRRLDALGNLLDSNLANDTLPKEEN